MDGGDGFDCWVNEFNRGFCKSLSLFKMNSEAKPLKAAQNNDYTLLISGRALEPRIQYPTRLHHES